jgi:pimeloyl-ACP methyl ester carboxylesterase
MEPFGKGIFARDRVLEKLSNIKVPTAVIVGEFDVAIPPEYDKRLAETIPNAEFYTIPDAGHSAAIEKPEEVTNAIKDFYLKIKVY